MLKITRLKDGKTFNFPEDSAKLRKSLEQTNSFYADSIKCILRFYGSSGIVGWEIVDVNDATCLLDAALYSVTDPDSIPRSEVDELHRMLRECEISTDSFRINYMSDGWNLVHGGSSLKKAHNPERVFPDLLTAMQHLTTEPQ